MEETQVISLGWEDPLEKGTAFLSSPVLLPGEFHAQRSVTGVRHDQVTSLHFTSSRGRERVKGGKG